MVKVKSGSDTAHLSSRIVGSSSHFGGKSFEDTSRLYLKRYLLKLE